MSACAQPVHALCLRVAPGEIAYIKFLFESYEEVAIVRTLDRGAAIIVVLIAADFLAPARAIVDELVAAGGASEVPAPAGWRDDWLMREIEPE